MQPQGPATLRPGTAYVNSTKYSDRPARLIPFTFSTEQTMALEFGDKYVRFHTAGKTLFGEDGLPYEVETPYEADDVFDIHYVQSMDVMTLVHPNYAPRELRGEAWEGFNTSMGWKSKSMGTFQLSMGCFDRKMRVVL